MTNSAERKFFISFVTETYKPEINGVANTLSNLIEGLKNQGHNIQVIRPKQKHETVTDSEEGIEELLVSGAPIPGYKDLNFGFPAKRKIKSLWQHSRPDIIYIATEGPLCLSALNVARFFNIPVASGFHTNFHAYSRYYRMDFFKSFIIDYLKFFHNRADMTLVPTGEMQETLLRSGFKNVNIVSRGVNIDLYSPSKRCCSLRESWGLTNNDIAVLYVGRVALEKNIRLAIRTFRTMQKENSKIKFIMVGDGPVSDQLREENGDFIFCGMKKGEELAKHYASGDILLFPSETETFGNIVTESMASGLAIIAYDYAAAHIHLNNKNQCGVTVTKGNEKEFIKQSVLLLKDNDRQKIYKERARSSSLNINWNTIVNNFLNIILQTRQRKVAHEHKQSGADVPLSRQN